jgi:orotidine-5'-phosphate decarboxylase
MGGKMKAIDQLAVRIKSANTLLCCGLDPDFKKLPSEIMRRHSSDEDKVREFLRTVVDVTAPHVCAFKAQKAFFDRLPGGHDVLGDTISYIHASYPGIPVIVDCKIGDIGNTMSIYAENLFGALCADGVVVNPYMGDDVFEPFAKWTDKMIVVLVKTSNPAGDIVQDMALANGMKVWEYILSLVVDRWNRDGNLVPVLSATADLDMARVRTVIPDTMPILLAGVGAQGGDYKDIYGLLNSQRAGVFVNSSRGILYPTDGQPWRLAVKQAAVSLKEALNVARSQ